VTARNDATQRSQTPNEVVMSKFKPSDKPRNTKSGTLRRLTEAQRKGKIGQELDELSELQLHVKKE
jgi:hypothetical protein